MAYSPAQRPPPPQVYLARGRTLGGSSSTNATLYLRGTAEDYDSWNLPGWKGADVLPDFVACETNSTKGESPCHCALRVLRAGQEVAVRLPSALLLQCGAHPLLLQCSKHTPHTPHPTPAAAVFRLLPLPRHERRHARGVAAL